MINIKNKSNCCGCSACEQICPHHCIKMISDKEGFLYPNVNIKNCIECHLCEKVCPILNVRDNTIPEDTPTYAAYNPVEKQRLTSSSGGVFQLLASYILDNKGIVCGAQFDEKYQVHHACIDNPNDLEKLKRSKYVQSSIRNVYKQIRSYLLEERFVMFVGTPCQIAGLKSFLRKEYERLLTVDLVCHGVPSPGVWQKYLHERVAEFAKQNRNEDVSNIKIEDISFRDKRKSWREFNLSISFSFDSNGINVISVKKGSGLYTKYAWEDEYMLSFLHNFSLRPSCYKCHFRNGKCKSDLTLADFWRINEVSTDEELIGEKGTSVVHINTKKGMDLFDKIECFKKEFSFSQSYNYSSLENWPQPPARFLFFILLKRNCLSQVLTIVEKVNKYLMIPYRIYKKTIKIWQR